MPQNFLPQKTKIIQLRNYEKKTKQDIAVSYNGYLGPKLFNEFRMSPNRATPQACTIALTYLELAAASYKLGACWAGYFNAAANFWPPMQKALWLPDGHVSFGAMMMGYSKFKYHRLPLRNEAKIAWF